MTDTTQTAQTTTDKVKAFFANAQVQATLRAAFALGGPAYLWFSGHMGLNDQQIGLLYQAIIMFGPSIIVWAISMAQKTHKAIIAEAARILASRQTPTGQPVGTIVIAPGAPDGAAKAVADPALKNVVPAGSDAAIKAATNQ